MNAPDRRAADHHAEEDEKGERRSRLDRHSRTGIFAFCSGMQMPDLTKVP
jgi:hypothetical protein